MIFTIQNYEIKHTFTAGGRCGTLKATHEATSILGVPTVYQLEEAVADFERWHAHMGYKVIEPPTKLVGTQTIYYQAPSKGCAEALQNALFLLRAQKCLCTDGFECTRCQVIRQIERELPPGNAYGVDMDGHLE